MPKELADHYVRRAWPLPKLGKKKKLRDAIGARLSYFVTSGKLEKTEKGYVIKKSASGGE